jgi:hypothetical protein
MPPLHTQLRNRLEATVKQARRTSEAAAKVAIERLTVGGTEPGAHLTPDERQLRNRLRAHGRQLGDGRDPKTGVQAINRLLQECAYEHWHRMLFARFLAENNLLIHHTEGMPVTLAECEELAVGEGAPDGWTLAARYAARMLPQIFRPDDPVLQVGFAPEHKRALEKLVTELPVEVFTSEDSLGWVYQFWQADRKDEVNASGDKITGETLPAVTQLFTEHYMVIFLLHNTIGAWWAARVKGQGKKTAWDACQTEDDCRKLAAVPGYEFTYLRFIKDGTGEWVPAAGAFPGWPKALKLFRLLDPCCGSGHFLVASFVLLALLRMQDEKLSAKEACDAVLRENLHGLELDPRCTQIAAFALALTAWKFTEGFRALPPLNIACSGLGVNARKEDWLALANGDKSLLYGMEQLYGLFQKAPELGSLINPRSIAQCDSGYDQGGDLYFKFADIQPLLSKALQSEKTKRNDDLSEIGVAAQGMATAATLLSQDYSLVATNVPYLARRKQSETVQTFSDIYAKDAKMDLATVFVRCCLDLIREGATTAVVTPHNWLFLGSYSNLRKDLLSSFEWTFLVRLGAGAFETISGEVVNVVLLAITKSKPQSTHGFFCCDVSEAHTPSEKSYALKSKKVASTMQKRQVENPDHRVTVETLTLGRLLTEYASTATGMQTFDSPRFIFRFWEMEVIGNGWVEGQSTVEQSECYGGRSTIVRWEDGRGQLYELVQAMERNGYSSGIWKAGTQFWGRSGILVSLMGDLPCSLYGGRAFDNNTGTIIPKDSGHLSALWAFCSSPQFCKSVREIDQSLKVTNATVAKIPFDLAHWQRVALEKFPQGLPKPDSNDPTQCLFNGHPVASTTPLHVGVARLLGYRWPRQNGQNVSGAAPVPEDGLEKFADEDGIVCIPPVRGEGPAAERLRALLAASYGKTWTQAKLDELLSAVNFAGSNLEDWLRNGFFDQHSKLFHHRPFIWQIWDGRKDGFSALVNYHKLDHKLLEKLTYTYLGEWIKKQQEAVTNQESGADDRLLKAQQLQDKLKLILEGEAPYDIFVRWKPLDQQPIGWHPDLNDGVRLNIRPFMEADILRKRPNIKWGIDRGKNPPGSPWGEERDNDRHLTLAEKRKARSH